MSRKLRPETYLARPRPASIQHAEEELADCRRATNRRHIRTQHNRVGSVEIDQIVELFVVTSQSPILRQLSDCSFRFGSVKLLPMVYAAERRAQQERLWAAAPRRRVKLHQTRKSSDDDNDVIVVLPSCGSK